MSEIAIGAFSGVIASAIIFLLRTLSNNFFIPYFQKVSYKGSIIEGQWVAEGEELDHRDKSKKVKVYVSLNIEQNAYKIKGFLDISLQRHDETESLNYTVNGYYNEGYLQLLCVAKQKGLSSYASILLKVVAAGSMLNGVMAFRNSPDDTVSQLNMQLAIKKN